MDTKESFAALKIQAQRLHDTTTFDTITDHRSLDNSNLAEPPAEERPRLLLSLFMPQSNTMWDDYFHV